MSFKNLLTMFLVLSVMMFTSNLQATPVIHGSTGFVTMPGTGTVAPGTLYLGGHFIANEPCIPISVGLGLADSWELSGAFEIEDDCVADPFLDVSTKYRYYEGSELHSAFGVSANLAFEETGGEDSVKFSIYNVIGRYAFGGAFAVGFGYTFGNDDNINYWMGYSLEILSRTLYLETDLSNFPWRFWWGDPAEYQNFSRGIGSIALRLKLAKILTLDFGVLDAMDANRVAYIGGNFKFSI